MMGDSPDDDPIARAILSDDRERRLRLEAWGPLSRYSPRGKLRLLAGVSLACTVAILLLTTFRAAALRQALDVSHPLAASVAASLVLAVGLKYLSIGGVGLVAVEELRRRHRDSNRLAERFMSLEETMGVIGIGIGGLGTLVGVGLLAVLALADPRTITTWLNTPATPVPLPVSYGLLVGWSSVLGVGLLAASFVVPSQEP